MFRVGQRVVCIWPDAELKKDEIYTITKIGLFLGKQLHVDVAEDDGTHPPLAWHTSRFRPLVSAHKSTDITIFENILRSARSLEEV